MGHDNWVKGISMHVMGQYFYSGSDDKSIRVWDLYKGRCVQKI